MKKTMKLENITSFPTVQLYVPSYSKNNNNNKNTNYTTLYFSCEEFSTPAPILLDMVMSSRIGAGV